jgi:hypothetical protein
MRYQYSANGGAWADLPAAKQVTGLGNGSTYSFRVRAVSTVDGAQYTGPETTAAATGKNTVDASSLKPYGPLANPSVTATQGSTFVTLSASASANGCGVTLHYQVDGAGWQTAASSYGPANVGNGYSQGHSIDAYATDSCGDQSATVSASNSSGPPPQPSASVTFGGEQDVSTCTGPTCLQTVLNVSNFPAGNQSLTCQWSSNGATNDAGSITISVNAPTNGSVGTGCTTGAGVWVRLVVGGVTTSWAKH